MATKVMIVMFSLVAAMALWVPAAEGATPKPQSTCPVLGGKINEALYVDTAEYRIYVCCSGCLSKVKADPAKYIAKIRANGEEPVRLDSLKSSSVSGEKGGTMCGACGITTCERATKVAERATKVAEPATKAAEPVVQAMAEIDTPVLSALIRSGVPVTILDARAGKYDDGRRIPGAQALAPDATAEQAGARVRSMDALIVTYCVNTHCPASKHLAERLRALGYTNVLEYPKGIEGWVADGGKADRAKGG